MTIIYTKITMFLCQPSLLFFFFFSFTIYLKCSNLTLFNMYLGGSDVHQLRNKKKIVLELLGKTIFDI